MIPKTIWQTWKSHDLPVRVAAYVRSWKQLNPTWQHALHDDEECREDVKKFGDPELLLVYDKMPLPVMKADLWRYLIVYENGGVYADVDTSCSVPIDQWMPDDAALVLGLENNVSMCQWAFAAEPKQQALAMALEKVVQRCRGYIDMSYQHVVHASTGPAVFTDAVREYASSRLGRPMATPLHLLSVAAELKSHGVYVHPQPHFGGGAVTNHYGGQWTDVPGYTPWLHQRAAFKDAPGDMQKAFVHAYDSGAWGGGSGPGSAPAYCLPLATFLSVYLMRSHYLSMCDLGCGDFQWMGAVVEATGIKYIGVDCVPRLIKQHTDRYATNGRYAFWHLDVANASDFPTADVYFIKDVLQHWTSDVVLAWLRRFFDRRPGARLLMVNCGGQAGDRVLTTGGFAPIDGDKYPLSEFNAELLFSWDTKRLYQVTAPAMGKVNADE